MVDRFDQRLLESDVFYDYYCPGCSNSRDGTFERHQISWQTVIHLVLYHLQHCSGGNGGGTKQQTFFRWKEDICGFIERHWDDLIPQKNPGVSWQNSVSSVLSAHHDIFVNGLEAKGETGWWALRAFEPPRLKQQSTGTASGKRRQSSVDDELEIKSEAGSLDLGLEGDDGDGEPSPATDSLSHKETSMVVKSAEMTGKPPISSDFIKKQLLSRLLSEDSSLIQAALTKVREQQQQQQQQQLIKQTAVVETHKTLTRSMTARVPPVENELLRILARIKNPDAKMRRLRRKLLSRKERRRCGIGLFDIDIFIYNYLKDPKPFNVQGERVNLMISEQAKPQELQEEQKLDISAPYLDDRYLSIKCRLMGISGCVDRYPFPIISPYSGRPLPDYIARDTRQFINSDKGAQLCSLKRLFRMSDPGTIDYLHLRREYVAQVNRLLSTFFWPGMDITDSLDYPDLSILAVYNTWLVVGCVLLDPDGYLSHLFVHPEWSSVGIGARLLDLVLQSAPPRDITLHVSATNPAMLLYNRLGFKPEQYIINHYDRHYRMAELDESIRGRSVLLSYSKHAFLMRLRR